MSTAARRAQPGRQTPLRSDLLAAAVVVLTALAIGLLVGVVMSPPAMTPDDALYASLAGRWLSGMPLQAMSGEAASIRGPGYVIAIAMATAAVHDWVLASRAVAGPAAGFVVLMAGAIARTVGGPAVAALAVIFVATPALVLGLRDSGIDGLQIAFILAAIAVALGGAPRWSTINAVVVGSFLGIAILVKETALVLVVWPTLWAVVQPAGQGGPAFRWAMRSTVVALAVVAPWWWWVYLETGAWFPTRLGGPIAAVGVASFGVAIVVAALLGRSATAQRVGGTIERLGSGKRWVVAVIGATAAATAVVVGFAFSQARFVLARRPSIEELWLTTSQIAALFPGPLLVAFVAWGLALLALVAATDERPALRGTLLALLLTSSSTAIVLVMGWEARSAIASVVLSVIILAAAVVGVLRWVFAAATRTQHRRIQWAAVILPGIVLLLFLQNAWGIAEAQQSSNRPGRGWDGSIITDAAEWLDANSKPGETVVAGWLYGWSVDVRTDSRFRWLLQPTVQLRIGRSGEPPFVPVGTLFREPQPLPSTSTGDYLFVRYHETEHYYVGLEASALAAALRQPTVGHLMVTGESQQSSAGITSSLDTWQGLRREVEFTDGQRRIIFYTVDPAAVAAQPSELQMTAETVRALTTDLGRQRPDITAGAFLRALLAGRPLVISPRNASASKLAEGLLAGP